LVSLFATTAIAQCETPLNCAVHQAQHVEAQPIAMFQISPETNAVGAGLYEVDGLWVSAAYLQDGPTFVYGFGKSLAIDKNISLVVGPVFGSGKDNAFTGGVNIGAIIHGPLSEGETPLAVSISYNRITDYTIGVGSSF
jgi:hypothetical protein